MTIKWSKLALGILVPCVVYLVGVAASPAQRLTANYGPIAPTFFGMHMHHVVKPNEFGRVIAWPTAVRFGSWRLVDAYVQWRDLEPQRGQWSFEVLDRYAELAGQHQVSLLYTFGHPPRWASARPDEPTYTYGPGVAAEPASMADWENYVRTVVSRYRGRIQAYEIWNEPWFTELESPRNPEGKAAYYSGSAAKMVELARVVHRVVKEVDPTATVLTPAFDHPETGAKRLDLYLSLGGKAFTDAVAFHLYSPAPESMLPTIAQLRAVMEKHGIGQKEMWNTESGYITANLDERGIAADSKSLSETDAAAYVGRSLVLAAAAGITRFYWYSWDNRQYGLTHRQGLTPHRAARAYDHTRRWLLGSRLSSCESADRRQWVCTLRRSERTAWIVWRTQGEGSWSPPSPPAQVETLDGKILDAPALGGITVGTSPVLVKLDRLPWRP